MTTFAKVETRAQHVLSVEGALPEPRQGYAGDYIPTKITFTVADPGSPEEVLKSTEVVGYTMSRKGVKGREMTMGHYWPMDWTKAPLFLQQAVRAAGLDQLTNLPL